MKKFFSVPPLHPSVLAYIKRQFPRVLRVFLILGFAYGTLFIGVSECDGLWNKLETETDTPVPTDTPSDTPVPTDTPSDTPVPTDTPTDTLTDTPTDTLTDTPTDTLTDTPTDTPTWTPTSTRTPTATPTRTPTSTRTPTLTETEVPTDTAYPGGPTSTPRPPKIPPPTNTTDITLTPMDSATAAGMGAASTTGQSAVPQGMIGASVTASLTPTSNGASVPGPGTGTGSNPKTNANGMPFLLLLAALVIGGGAFFAFKLRGRRGVYNPSMGGGGASATMSINPATVGAFGFAAWLTGQAPMPTDSEKVVLSKVGNGIGSAINLVGGSSDLNNISEMGTQESLQLTTSPPFPTAAVPGAGSSEDK